MLLSQVELLPQSSVAVKVTVYIPVPPHASIKLVSKSFVKLTSEQSSEAVAVASQLVITASFTGSPHSNSISLGQDITGAVVSSIVNTASVVAVFPQSSVAVNITVMLPVSAHSSDKLPLKS